MLKKLVLLFSAMAVFTFSSCGNWADSKKTEIKIGALKGPSSMGMVGIMDKNDKMETANAYEFYIAGSPEDIVAKVSSEEINAAAVPTNLASTLYNKTGGDILVASVNTLGSLYILENGNTIQSVQDLKGKTVYNTGKGAAPECVLNFVLKENGIDREKDVEIEYMGEHSELAAGLSSNEVLIGCLPEPNVTAVLSANKDARVALDLNAEWDKACNAKGIPGSMLTMGCLIVNKDFYNGNKDAFIKMLNEYKESVSFVNDNPKDASLLVEKYGIMPKAAVAEAAIPKCNIVYIDGDEMKKSVDNYLKVLFEAEPKLVGGKLPDGDSFYISK